MSNWTHVAGVVRLDCLRIFNKPDPDFDKMFGKAIETESDWDKFDEHPDLFLPAGSEGTLSKQIWINPKKNYLDAYAVTIFGDLRDHEDPQEIIDWFKQKCEDVENYGCSIRNAVIQADNEWHGRRVWSYGEDDE